MSGLSKLLIFISLAFLCVGVTQAGMEPQVLIKSVATETLKRVKADKELIKKDSKYINRLVNELVLPHFDFESMSKWAMGKYWRKAKKDQREAFIKEFKSLLIRTYATSLSEYTEQSIKYLPFRGKLASGDVTVRSEVEQPGGFPIPIDYKLHKKGSDWKVYDVKIDDISLVANYRSSFSKQIRRSGIDALIKKLSKKMSDLTVSSENGQVLLTGDISYETVLRALNENIFSSRSVESQRISVNFSGIGHVDSSGLALMLHWLRLAKKQNIDVEFTHIPKKLVALAEMSNLEEVLPIS